MEARRHRLADRDGPRDDGSVHWRDDVGIPEVYQSRFERCLILMNDRLVNRDLSGGLIISILGTIDRVLRDDTSLHQPRVALIGNLLVGEIGLILE